MALHKQSAGMSGAPEVVEAGRVKAVVRGDKTDRVRDKHNDAYDHSGQMDDDE